MSNNSCRPPSVSTSIAASALVQLAPRCRNVGVIRTAPRANGRTPAGLNTSIVRIGRALEMAGVKIEGKATDGGRATHLSWGDASADVTSSQLHRYVGHRAPIGGSTDGYIRQILKQMRPEHRRYIKDLPSPDEIRGELTGFVPPVQWHWKERKAPEDRSKAGKEARRKRVAERKPLGLSVDQHMSK